MQIFNTSSDPRQTARDLDNSRLNKQVMEAAQLCRLLLMHTHPKVLVWEKSRMPMHYAHPVTVFYRTVQDPYQPFRKGQPLPFLFGYISALEAERKRRKPETKPHKYLVEQLLPLVEEHWVSDPETIPTNLLYHYSVDIHKMLNCSVSYTCGVAATEVCRFALQVKWANGLLSFNPRKRPRWTNCTSPAWFRPPDL